MNKSKKTVIHMDSSGKFLKQGKGKKKRLLNTAIVIPPPAPGHASFPILELISEENKTIDFKIFLQTGWSLLSKAIGDGEVANPNIAVTDCAFPNIHSLMSVFNQTKLPEYLEGIYRSFMSKQPVTYKTIVTLCINHLLPIMLKTARAVTEKVVADTVVAAVLLVLQAKTIEEALTVWEQVVIAFCSKEVTEEVGKARDFIKAKSKGDLSEFEDLSQFNYDFEDGTEKSEEIEFGNRILLRVNSPFFKLFKRSLDKAKKGQEQILRTTNRLYAPQCLETLVKQYLSLFPLLSATLLDGAALFTNSNVELYWQEQRRIVKDIPDRLMWPPRYLGRLLHNVRNEAKNMLLHNIVPSLKFGGKVKPGSDIHFADYIDDDDNLGKKEKNIFKPTPTKSERKKKRKVKETFYGCQEDWDSQKKRTPKKSNYLKNKTIDFPSIIGEMDPPVEFIRVTGTRRALGKDEGENTVNLSPMAIQLRAEDIRLINNKHEYITTDAVDAGLCLLDRKLNEETSLNVTVYSSQNCRLIFTGVPDLVQDGKFITVIPRNFGLDEEASRLAGSSDSVPGSHFTLISNLFCGEDEVNIYETYGPLRDAKSLLTPTGKKLIKRLCNSVYEGDITVNCINVAEQEESECGVLSVALAVHLCFYAESENAIYNRIVDVRKTFLDCLKHNSLTYFKMAKRHLDDNQKTVLSLRI
jgi:hypothetical protein